MSFSSSPVKFAELTKLAFHSGSVPNPYLTSNTARVCGKSTKLRQNSAAVEFRNYMIRLKFLQWWVSSFIGNRALFLMGDMDDSRIGLAENFGGFMRDIRDRRKL